MSNKKVILVTGASSGMGKLSAQDLIKAGHIVYCVARSVDKMKDLEQIGGHVMKMDVTNEADIEAVVAKVIKEQGRIDVLWNNAGYGLYGPVEDLSMEKVQQQFEVNVYGVARLTKAVLPYMREKREGLILNTSSMGGKIYTPLGAWYHATKHAIEGFSDCLRIELKEFNIKVVVLEPGMINTGFTQGVRDNFSFESQNGPYKTVVNAYIKAMENPPMKGSDPKVISNTVLKIINARRPKTRYLVGQGSHFLVGLRRLFGDRVYDALMLRQMR
ncbi:oxidoreductase [Streptococcus macacae]|uniref:Short chain dehydrogenase n=1 Tax=Streptococcus macacae NCTC 11558 TaxID=764298 RepID=G5JXU8_9STRE|nr:oxidoreductase [Streptococcus macacae]EHJ53364.1 short chain dehydrogenase [Streptococcus macacae NCTC 11558]SUN77655.1 short chain dehydrogenase [Streptococcus macacae NCTC 11558]